MTESSRPEATTPPAATSGATLALRVLALAGIWALCRPWVWTPSGNRPDTEWTYVLIAAVGSLVVLVWPARAGARTLRRHPDLLVPFGCYQLALVPLEWLPIEYLQFSWMHIVNSPFDLAQPMIVALVARLAIGSIYAAWQTLVVIQAVTSNGVDLAGELRHAVTLLPRTMALIAIGYTGMMLPFLLVVLFQLPVSGGSLTVFLVLTLIWSLFWGYRTCLYLPIALDRSVPLLAALRNATAAGREIWRMRPVPILAWAIALGLFCVHVLRSGSQSFGNSHINYHLLPQWYGDYLHENKWYLELVSDAEVPPIGFFALPLAVLAISLSIAIKATLIRHIDGPVPTGRLIEVHSLTST